MQNKHPLANNDFTTLIRNELRYVPCDARPKPTIAGDGDEVIWTDLVPLPIQNNPAHDVEKLGSSVECGLPGPGKGHVIDAGVDAICATRRVPVQRISCRLDCDAVVLCGDRQTFAHGVVRHSTGFEER